MKEVAPSYHVEAEHLLHEPRLRSSFIIYIAPIQSRPNFSEALPNPDRN